MKSVPALRFEYQPSRIITFAIILFSACAMLAITACGLPSWAKVVLEIAASIYAALSLKDFLRPSFRYVHWHAAGHWRLRDADDREHIAELHSAVIVGGVISLSLRSKATGMRTVLLLSDNCDAETRRRLRVRLARVNAETMA
jgi:toxin CptA